MFYLNAIKRLYDHIKNNNEIPEAERQKAKELLNELSRLLVAY